jgi:hypothetical protein
VSCWGIVEFDSAHDFLPAGVRGLSPLCGLLVNTSSLSSPPPIIVVIRKPRLFTLGIILVLFCLLDSSMERRRGEI